MSLVEKGPVSSPLPHQAPSSALPMTHQILLVRSRVDNSPEGKRIGNLTIRDVQREWEANHSHSTNTAKRRSPLSSILSQSPGPSTAKHRQTPQEALGSDEKLHRVINPYYTQHPPPSSISRSASPDLYLPDGSPTQQWLGGIPTSPTPHQMPPPTIEMWRQHLPKSHAPGGSSKTST